MFVKFWDRLGFNKASRGMFAVGKYVSLERITEQFSKSGLYFLHINRTDITETHIYAEGVRVFTEIINPYGFKRDASDLIAGRIPFCRQIDIKLLKDCFARVRYESADEPNTGATEYLYPKKGLFTGEYIDTEIAAYKNLLKALQGVKLEEPCGVRRFLSRGKIKIAEIVA